MNNNNNNKIKVILLSIIAPFGISINNFAYSQNLLEIYQLAAQKDPLLQKAFADFKSVEQNVPIAVAELLPKVTLNAGINYDKILNFTSTVNNLKNPSVHTKYFGLNVNQPLFYWDKISRYLQSEIEVEKAIHDLEIAKEDLLVRVSQAYFNVLEAQDNLEFISTEKRAIKQLYDEAKERFNVGFIPSADLDEAQAKLDLKTSDEIDAQNQVASRYDELIEIVNQNINNLSVLTPKFKPSSPKPSDIKKWLDMAMDRNHTLVSARLDEKVIEKNEDIAFAGHLPNASATLSDRAVTSNKSLQIDDISTAKGYINSRRASIEGNLELFAGGGTQAAWEQAQFDTKAATYNTERVTRETKSKTKQAYRNVLTIIEQIKALEQAVVSGLSALDATRAGYDVGTRASIDVLDRLTDLYEQKQKLSSARYNYIKNVIDLKRLAGVLTDRDIRTIDNWLITDKQKTSLKDKSDVKSTVIKDVETKDAQFINDIKSGKIKPTTNELKNLIKPMPKKSTPSRAKTLEQEEKDLLQEINSKNPNIEQTDPSDKNNSKGKTEEQLEKTMKQLESDTTNDTNTPDNTSDPAQSSTDSNKNVKPEITIEPKVEPKNAPAIDGIKDKNNSIPDVEPKPEQSKINGKEIMKGPDDAQQNSLKQLEQELNKIIKDGKK